MKSYLVHVTLEDDITVEAENENDARAQAIAEAEKWISHDSAHAHIDDVEDIDGDEND